MLQAARWNTGRKNDAKNRHLSTIAQLCWAAISSQLRHEACMDNQKKLLSNNISSRCSYNIVNFGPLTAEIYWRVWGTPANFSWFRVLAALLYSSARQPNFAALNRGNHLYSKGRPSRWTLDHILV